MVRYKIDHPGVSWDEEHWMPAGDNTEDFIVTWRQNTSNVWAVAARYNVHDESTPTPVPTAKHARHHFRDDTPTVTPTPCTIDGMANVVVRGPHQSDTSENIAKKIMSGIANHPIVSASGFMAGHSGRSYI